METDSERGYRGGWAGPAAVIVLLGAAIILLGWFEVGLIEALMRIP